MAQTTIIKERLTEETRAQHNSIDWRRLVVFSLMFAGVCLLIFNDLGRFPLFNPDEALYAEPAREMLEKNEYITTLLNYAVRFTKPPLSIWWMAANYQIFGVTEFAARYSGAACAAILVAANYLFVRKYVNARAAVFSAFMLVTAPLFLGTAREAITDMPLSLFVAGSLISFYHGYASNRPAFRWIGYVLIGLAIMTKGPVGLLLPTIILAAFHALRGDTLKAVKYYKPWYGALIVAAIAVPWFAVEITITKGAYFREFILRENFQRFTGVVDHKAPWWYHIAAMFGGFFPWSIFLPLSLINAFRIDTNVAPVAVQSPYKHISDRQSVLLFSGLTALITLLFFSSSVSKLLPYTVPAFPALALLIGAIIDRFITQRSIKALTISFAILLAVYSVGGVAVPFVTRHLQDCPPQLSGLITAFLAVQCCAAILALILVARKQLVYAAATFMSLTFLSYFVIGSKTLEVFSDHWELPIQSFSQYAAVSDWPILVYQIRKPSVTFYAKRKILLPRGKDSLLSLLRTKKCAYIISRSRDTGDFASITGCKQISHMGSYVLTSWIRPTSMPVAIHAQTSSSVSGDTSND